MSSFISSSRGPLAAPLSKLILSGLVLLTGIWIVSAPLKAWIVVCSVLALALLEIEPVYWVLGSLLAVVLSRTAVAFGAPHFLNFVHFPLVLGAALVAWLKGNATAKAARHLGFGIITFLVFNLLSWVLNGGEPLRPVLNWLVLTEPFLLVYALLTAPPEPRMAAKIWRLLIGLALVQVVLGIYQWLRLSHGNPDLVQGSFIASGTGAHVAGSIALLGVLLTVCKAATARRVRERLTFLCLAAPLLGLSVIADAKQAIFCFMPGLFLAIVSCTRLRPTQFILPAGFATAALYIAFLIYPPLQIIANQSLVSEGLAGKFAGFSVIVSDLWSRPGAWLLGLGPGNTVSRVALLTPEAELDSSSSVAAFGLKTSPITKQLIQLNRSNYVWSSSSVWSTECSWFGLLGDLGPVGLLLYLWMVRLVWGSFGKEKTWKSAVAKGSAVMAAGLGGVYVWLEEPGFMLAVALIASLAILARQPVPPVLRRRTGIHPVPWQAPASLPLPLR